MAQQAQGKTFHYQQYCLFRDAILGTGAYGQVYKAKLDELPCAAKLLHPILVDQTDPKNQTNLQKFEQECRFLSEICHPNIVQYLGMEQDEESELPVLLMELMDESLTHFLEQSDKLLPYHVQVDISHDIALALAYLHSNNIIHRDLSSNNVLLIGPGYRAKVTDFGMSKLSEMHPHMTQCPGTAAYMAPEALLDGSVYDNKLDVFQAGVLMIQIITRKFPDPGPAIHRKSDQQSATGVMLMPVPETERRQNHLSLIPQTHPMLCLSLDCLKDRDKDRPTAQQVCQQLSTLKEAPQYVQSHQEREGEGTGGDGERERERESRERMREFEKRETEVEGREEEVGRREEEIERREREVVRREKEVKERERETERETEWREEGSETSREREVERSHLHQLEDKDQIIEEKTQELRRKNEELQEKTREVQRRDEELQGKASQLHKKDLIIYEMTQEKQKKDEELQAKMHQLQEKDQIIDGKTRQLQEKDRELQIMKFKMGRKDEVLPKMLLLCAIVGVVGIYVGIIAQPSSVAEKVQVITQLERSLAEKEQNVTQLHSSLAEKKQIVIELQRSLIAAIYTCHVSGPGLSATANYPTYVILELSDASGQPCSLRQNLTAELQSVDQSVVPNSLSVAEVQLADKSEPLASTSTIRWPWSKKKPQMSTPAPDKSVCQYKVSYTVLSRGQHKLHIRLNGSEVSGSPFNITVYPDPTQLGKPLKVLTGLKHPYGIAINSHGEMVVSNFRGHNVTLVDREGKEIQIYGSEGDRPHEMRYPTSVAVDNDDNVYVTSDHKLQKFSRDGHFITYVGQRGSKDGEFIEPQGVKFYCGRLYVCDRYNNRIQVFDTNLNFLRTIGSSGSGRRQFNQPRDVDFDYEGNAYISDNQNHRIQVIDSSGQFVQQFGQEEGEGKLERPTAVHVMGQFVYVWNERYDHHSRITVYQTSGQFVMSFGKHTDVELGILYSITSDCNGLIYIPDLDFDSIRVF